jgi:hypothetical protein
MDDPYPLPLLTRLVAQHITNNSNLEITQAYFEFLLAFYLPEYAAHAQAQVEQTRNNKIVLEAMDGQENWCKTRLKVELYILHIAYKNIHP